MIDWSDFLINSHDPLRGHVLKHIRQNSLTSLRYSVEEQGKGEVREERITKYPTTCQHLLSAHEPSIKVIATDDH